MTRRLLPGLTLLVAALMASQPGLAAPRALDGDGRVSVVAYSSGAIVPLRTAIGNTLTVILGPGEQILVVEVGDPGAFQVTVAGSGDSLFVTSQRMAAPTSMAVQTNLRRYEFELLVGAANQAVYALQFSYAPTVSAEPTPMAAVMPPMSAGHYRLSGTRTLRPSELRDDGLHTYIDWPDDTPLPAVFAVGALGEEETVDGYMRGGLFTIDRVYPKLIFRIGRKSAAATRSPIKSTLAKRSTGE